jgi:CDP-glucose 4,6-dehydratase
VGARNGALEGLAVSFDAYTGRKVLVTGHTGFKGSWLSAWLQGLGARVAGLALAPESQPNHWDVLGLDMPSHLVDIRDGDAVARVFELEQPEIVFHLAAQSLVRRSYAEPQRTWDANVMGTVNVLEGCRKAPALRAIVVATTDKCYENREWVWGYRESDRLGGRDPYSASKAAAELVASSYRDSFLRQAGAPLLATVRAGNVVGGGDWSEDRLIPDLARAVAAGKSLAVRSPRAVRPWQHVLESLSGYLRVGESLLAGNSAHATAWNFGPDQNDARTVGELLDSLRRHWPDARWHAEPSPDAPHEAGILKLDCTKAAALLGWRPALGIDDALRMTAEWYGNFFAGGRAVTHAQIADYSRRLAEVRACR